MIWISGKDDGHRQGRLLAPDGVEIPYREWACPSPRAVILYMHGQGDHTGPFTAMGDQLHQMDYHILAHDHRGFGVSGAPRGDISSYDYFINDALAMLHHAKAQFAGLPLILIGYSMGGHIALRTAYRAGADLAGLIMLSPGFKLKTKPRISTVLKVALLNFLAPDRPLPAPTSRPVVTSRNLHHLQQASQDEHWVRSYTARFYYGAVLSLRQAWQEAAEIKIPTLVLQSGDDQMVCPDESRRFFERIPHEQKEFHLLEGLYHNLVVEPEMPEIAHKIGNWISRLALGNG